MFDDLLYVKFRQQELWQEAAAQALAAKFQAARPGWRVRVLGALQRLLAASPWQTSEPATTCPLSRTVTGLAPARHGGQKL